MDELSPTPEVQKTSVGGWIGIAIVVVLFAAGGAYFFYTQEQKIHSMVVSADEV